MDILAEPIEQEVNVDGATPQGALFVSVKNTGANAATFNGYRCLPEKPRATPLSAKAIKHCLMWSMVPP